MRPPGKYSIYSIGQKKVTFGRLFRSKNDENRACVTKIIFFNGVCKTRLFVLVLRAQSGCFTHGVCESRACADQFTFAYAVCETASSRMQNKQKGVSHTPLKKLKFDTRARKGR